MSTNNTPTTKRLDEASLLAKHPHIVEGSLRYDAMANKQKVTIQTRGIDGTFDGNTREIATSDLHQTFWTQETKDALDRAKRNAKARGKRATRKTGDDEQFVILDDAEATANAPTGLDQLADLLS